MDTYTGKRTSEGCWVALGPHAELVAHCEAGDVIEVTTPTRNVARAYVTRVGRPFTKAGLTLGYGYLAQAGAVDGAA